MSKKRKNELVPAEGIELPPAVAETYPCPCCGDHVHIPFKVDQEFKDSEGKTYAVRVVQDGCLLPGATPFTAIINVDQLPKPEAH